MVKLTGYNPLQKLIAAAAKPATTPGSDKPECTSCPGCQTKRQHNRQKDAGATPAAASKSGIVDDFESELKRVLEPGGPLPRWKFNRGFINKETGMGLVSTEFIPAGSIVYSDQLILVTEAEKRSHNTPSELDALLAKKVAEKDPKWQEAFLTLPNPREEELGKIGGIWDEFHFPLYHHGEGSSVLGLNLAFTNHSCMPNSSLTMFLDYPVVDGKQRTDMKPTLGGAAVRSFMNIHKGQEITVSYFYSKGEVNYRRLYALDLFGFRCACQNCLHPKFEAERALRMYDLLDRTLNNPKIVCEKPAVAFQAANNMTNMLTDRGIADSRTAMIWAKCALIAGFHSDIGRVRCFLNMVIKLIEILQGPSGLLFQRALKWFQSMSVMPGFGITTRGLSSMRDANVLVDHSVETKPFLFMVGAMENEYIRVSRCRRISDKPSTHGAKHHTMRFVVVPDPRAKEASPVKANQKQDQNTKSQKASKKKRRSNMKKKKRTTATGKKTRETCIDPERDFLALWTRVVNDFIDHGSHEPSVTMRKGKNTAEDAQSMEQKNHDHNINNYAMAQETALEPDTPKKSVTKQMSTIAHKPAAIRQVKAQHKVVVQRVPVEMVQALQSQGLVQGAVSVHGSIQGSSAGSSHDSSSEKS